MQPDSQPDPTSAWDPANWLTRWKADPSNAMTLLRAQSKTAIRDTLDHIQRHFAPDEHNVQDLSPITLIFDLLKERRNDPPRPQFLRFKFTHNSARDLLLSQTLRAPEIYNLHPEPDAAAAIMVSISFDPQLASRLLNYTQVAKTLDIH